MHVTERLAKWATNVAPEHTPAARLSARHAIQDVVGCMTAGAGDEGAAKVRDAVNGLGDGRSVIVGRLGADVVILCGFGERHGGACIGF